MRFSDLTPGYAFPSTVLALDVQTVERYLRATQDDNAVYWRDGAVHLVPPLAVAALAFRGIAQGVALAPGSLHTGQDLLFRRLVTVGERLTAQAYVTASSRRRGFVALAIDLAATDDSGETALAGSLTLMVAGAQDSAPAGTTGTAQGRVEGLEEGHGVQYAVCAVRLENAAAEALMTGEARVDVKKVP